MLLLRNVSSIDLRRNVALSLNIFTAILFLQLSSIPHVLCRIQRQFLEICPFESFPKVMCYELRV